VSEKPLVLVAHFDAGERERIAGLLRAAGAEVEAAADGETAARLANERGFSLVVAACLLPKVSGFELCRRVTGTGAARGSEASVPTVLLCDVDDPYVRARARHVGARKLLFGAVGEPELRELLTTCFEGVDPLDLSGLTHGGRKSHELVRELLGGSGPREGEPMFAKVTDPVTGLLNGDFLALKEQEECKRCTRYGQPLALLVAEIENHDRLVADHGRAVGDEALLEVAGVFLCESRDVDVAGRVGEARFHLLLPNTNQDGARVLAERILDGFAGRAIGVGGREIPITIRVGVAALPGGAKCTADEFVLQAERDLSTARSSSDGRSDALRAAVPVEPLPLKPATNG